MKAVVQRVYDAECQTDDGVTGTIDKGLVVFLGVRQGDTHEDLDALVDKVLALRIFENDDGKMDQSVQDVEGDILLIPQFTLYADVTQGRRPSFNEAEEPGRAEDLYEDFLARLRDRHEPVEEGAFAEMMDISLTHDGPVTILLESKELTPDGG